MEPTDDNEGLMEKEPQRMDSTIDTVQVDVSSLQLNSKAGDSNNILDTPIEKQKLEVDNMVTARLTQKPPEKYKFRKSIGRGGMKMVIQVRDMDTTRDVAMAILPDAASRPRQDILKFVEEARLTASLEHPNIVPVHDIGIDSTGAPYFTMKLLRGETLASLINKLHEGNPEYLEAYKPLRLLRIFLKICHGVAFAHSKGVLHLDLKPENIQVGDFGEVLIMDWGLAKIIHNEENEPNPEAAQKASESEQFSTATNPNQATANLTMDGIMKGTPGYMAPEQALGQNSKKDFRTDVYALGGILYAMTTFLPPIEVKNIKDMIKDTLSGNIIPPKMRAPEQEIPKTLEAVIQKAMSVNPDNRYNTVKGLRDDVYAFLGGYTTLAERATTAKKTLLFLKRHRIIMSFLCVIFLLLLSGGIYLFNEHARQNSDWTCFYQQSFTTRNPSLAGLRFTNSMITENVPPWKLDQKGLKMEPGEWLWIDRKNQGNQRLVLTFTASSNVDAIEVCLNSKIEPLRIWWNAPTGYSFQFGGNKGARDSIFRNPSAESSELIIANESRIQPGKQNTVIFMRKDADLTLSAKNEKNALHVTDFFPPTGENLDRIGIRTFANAITIQEIAAYTLPLPEKTSPLVSGDTLVEVMLFEKAIQKYISIADSYSNLPLSDAALIKAYVTAATKLTDPKLHQKYVIEIKKRIARKPGFLYQEPLKEIDALSLWKEQHYEDALACADDLFAINPNTNIISKLLQLPHLTLSKEIRAKLFQRIRLSRNLKRLDISSLGIESLEPLRGLNLTYLDCSSNNLKSLSGVEQMPLETLLCGYNNLSDLSPLAAMPLKVLTAQFNRIEDIDVLSSLQLNNLNLNQNQIRNLAPLSYTQLEQLSIRGNLISDLEPLRALPLKKLDAGKNPIETIDALRALSLETVHLDSTPISDISPLAGMPLVMIELHNCKNLKDLSPLYSMPLLERVSVPSSFQEFQELEEVLPSLKILSTTSITDLAPTSKQPGKTIR